MNNEPSVVTAQSSLSQVGTGKEFKKGDVVSPSSFTSSQMSTSSLTPLDGQERKTPNKAPLKPLVPTTTTGISSNHVGDGQNAGTRNYNKSNNNNNSTTSPNDNSSVTTQPKININNINNSNGNNSSNNSHHINEDTSGRITNDQQVSYQQMSLHSTFRTLFDNFFHSFCSRLMESVIFKLEVTCSDAHSIWWWWKFTARKLIRSC